MPSPELFLVRTLDPQGKRLDTWIDLKSGLNLSIVTGAENQKHVIAEGQGDWSAIIYHSDQYDKCQSFIESLSQRAHLIADLSGLRRKAALWDRVVEVVNTYESEFHAGELVAEMVRNEKGGA